MNPEYQFLYFLSVLAASTTFARMNAQSETTAFDWIALGSLVLLIAQVLSLAVKPWL